MHILFLTDNFPPEVNASASRVFERARYWVKWGHQVSILTCAPNYPAGKLYPGYKNKWRQIETMDGITVVRVKTFMSQNKGFLKRFLDQGSFTFSSVLNGLSIKHVDVIVATTPTLFAGSAGKWLSRLKRKPFVLEVSDLWPESIAALSNHKGGFIYNSLQRLACSLYKAAKEVITLSPAFNKRLTDLQVPQEKVHTVINGVEISNFQPSNENYRIKLNIPEDHLIIGYIGTHGMAHNLKNVVLTAKQLQHEKVTFVLVGDGAEKASIKNLAADLQINNILFIDQQPKSEIANYWNLCDIALVHLKNVALFDGVIPSKIFEAMALKLPILYAGPQGVASKIIESNQAGVCVSSETEKPLSDAILELKNNPEKRQMLADNSANSASKYTREKQAEDFIKVLEKAIS